MQEKDSMEFELSKVLPYSIKGNKSETASVTMRAPRMPEINEASDFSQIVTQAFMDAQKWVNDSDEKKTVGRPKKQEDMDAGAVRIMLFASERNIKEINRRFKALANRVCTLDDDGSPLKESLMDKMEMEDFLSMMCEYVANFTYPSLFNATEDKEGKKSAKQNGELSEAT